MPLIGPSNSQNSHQYPGRKRRLRTRTSEASESRSKIRRVSLADERRRKTRHSKPPRRCSYKCKTCNKTFNYSRDFNRHVRNLHTKGECQVCKKWFFAEVAPHFKTSHRPKKGICAVGDASFKTSTQALKHFEKVHVKRQCAICRFPVENDDWHSLNKHFFTCHGYKRNSRLTNKKKKKKSARQKSVCGRSKSIQENHKEFSGPLAKIIPVDHRVPVVRLQRLEVIYNCPKCRLQTQDLDALKDHFVSFHIGFDCRQCKERIVGKSFVERHVHTSHPGTLGFVVDFSDATDKAEIAALDQIHITSASAVMPNVKKDQGQAQKPTGKEKDFCCPYCFRLYVYPESLKKHMAYKHDVRAGNRLRRRRRQVQSPGSPLPPSEE